MTAPTTPQLHSIVQTNVLYIAFELSKEKWKVAICAGIPDEMLRDTVDADDYEALGRFLFRAQAHFQIDNVLKIYSVYEAGFDGFRIHRALTEAGFTNFVIDPASIEVNRRGRRRKTDKIDVRHLLRKLVAFLHGDRAVFSVCEVPDRQDEDDRRLEREFRTLTDDRTRLLNRAGGLLRLHGLDGSVRKLLEDLDDLTSFDSRPIPLHAEHELARLWIRICGLDEQLEQIKRERKERLAVDDPKSQKAHKIMRLKGVGAQLAWVLTVEMFGWRAFANRRQIGRFVGFDSAPYDTGKATGRTQGISKAGNKWVRAIGYSLVMNWLRWQPESELSQWYQQRYKNASSKDKHKGKVALARKLLVRIWRWVEFDEVPRGVVFSD